MGELTVDLPLRDPADLATWGFFLGAPAPGHEYSAASWFAPVRLLMPASVRQAVESSPLPCGVDPAHPSLVVQVLLVARDGMTFETWWSGDAQALVVTMLEDDGGLSASDALSIEMLAALVADHLAWHPNGEFEDHAALSASVVLMHVDGDCCTELKALEFVPDPEDPDAVLVLERDFAGGILRTDVVPLIIGLATGTPHRGPVPRAALTDGRVRWVAGAGSDALVEDITAIGESATLELTASVAGAELLLLSGPRGTLLSDETSEQGEPVVAVEERGVLVGLVEWLVPRAHPSAEVTIAMRATTSSGATVLLDEAFVIDRAAPSPLPNVEAGESVSVTLAPDAFAIVGYLARELGAVVTRAPRA